MRRSFAAFRRPAFVIVAIVVATYNFVFFTVLGYGPVALGLGVVPLGLVFTGWGVGLALGILVIFGRRITAAASAAEVEAVEATPEEAMAAT
ncbi:hypothetical protein [Xylanimonas sp. McL0601]|uniref:hypothetical protein n=1 Tax=Xylanimonas sp. McL0601 TaxID=3414739 RepID=UPI003CEF65BB